MDYMDHFERKPGICGGSPVIRGTRVPVKTILASLAEGDSVQEIRKDFPVLSPQDIKAVIALAAAFTGKRMRTDAFPLAS